MKRKSYKNLGEIVINNKIIAIGSIEARFTEYGYYSVSCNISQINNNGITQNAKDFFVKNDGISYLLISSIKFETNEGKCEISGQLHYNMEFSPNNVLLRFQFFKRFTFQSKLDSPPLYAYLYLTNFRFPDGGNEKSRIKFLYRDEMCSIEPIAKYIDILDSIIKRKIPESITAVMKYRLPVNSDGKIREGEFIFSDFLLFYLSVLCGNKVSIAWIEMCDQYDKILQCDHLDVFNVSFHEGHRLLGSNISVGASRDPIILYCEALSKMHISPFYLNKKLRVVLDRLIAIGSYSTKLEDKLDYIIRCFDILIHMFKDTNNNIEDIMKSSNSESEPNKYYDLINTVPMPGGWGKNVEKIVQVFELIDAELMNEYLCHNPLKINKKHYSSWGGLISYIRGCILHEGYIECPKHKQLAIDIAYHLHDVLLRITLRMLNYEDRYQSPISNRSELVNRDPEIQLYGKLIKRKRP